MDITLQAETRIFVERRGRMWAVIRSDFTDGIPYCIDPEYIETELTRRRFRWLAVIAGRRQMRSFMQWGKKDYTEKFELYERRVAEAVARRERAND